MTPAELVSAVRARLDELEQLAKAAGYHHWRLGVVYGTVLAGNDKTVARDMREYDAEHAVAHDPAAVLRRVAADRQILAAHDREHYCPLPVVVGINGQLWTAADGPCYTLRLLADGLGIDLEEAPQ